MRPPRVLFALVFGLMAGSLAAEEPRRIFPEARHGAGELRYLEGVPVLVVQGTPTEIGEQFAELAVKPAIGLTGRIKEFAKSIGAEGVFPLLLKGAAVRFPFLPKDHQTELEAVSRVSKVDRELLIFANCVPDLHTLGGCSTLVVEPARSATGKLLFGRNLDWPPFADLPDYTLVVVYRATGKHACACVTIPPVLGCISGMNDAGLCITINMITQSKDGSEKTNAAGVPMLPLFRRVLEECATVDEAEKLLKSVERTTYYALTVCDPKAGCVLEVTPKNVVRRNPLASVGVCTNHFLTDALGVPTQCDRLPKLEAIQRGRQKLGKEQVIEALHAVNQKDWTMQSMVFEPADRVLHLSYATGGTATAKPFHALNLKPLFENGWAK